MHRSSSPPPRWLRRVVAFVPLTVLTVCPALVFLVHPMLIDVVTVLMSLAAVLVGVWVVKVELRADRHATPSMAATYRALTRLLDGAHDREVRVDSQYQVTILLMNDRGENGSTWRSVLRLNQTELDEAGWNGVSTPVVFDEFVLDHAHSVVRHRFGAVMITRDSDGHACIVGIPAPEQDEVDADVARMLDRTGVDIALTTDLDDLIKQIRAGVALVP